MPIPPEGHLGIQTSLPRFSTPPPNPQVPSRYIIAPFDYLIRRKPVGSSNVNSESRKRRLYKHTPVPQWTIRKPLRQRCTRSREKSVLIWILLCQIPYWYHKGDPDRDRHRVGFGWGQLCVANTGRDRIDCACENQYSSSLPHSEPGPRLRQDHVFYSTRAVSVSSIASSSETALACEGK